MSDNLGKILKWVGILALLALPIFVATKSKKATQEITSGEEDNIFAEELSDR